MSVVMALRLSAKHGLGNTANQVSFYTNCWECESVIFAWKQRHLCTCLTVVDGQIGWSSLRSVPQFSNHFSDHTSNCVRMPYPVL